MIFLIKSLDVESQLLFHLVLKDHSDSIYNEVKTTILKITVEPGGLGDGNNLKILS